MTPDEVAAYRTDAQLIAALRQVEGQFNFAAGGDAIDAVIQLERIRCIIQARIDIHAGYMRAAPTEQTALDNARAVDHFTRLLHDALELEARYRADDQYSDTRWPAVTFAAERNSVQALANPTAKLNYIRILIRAKEAGIHTARSFLPALSQSYSALGNTRASIMKSEWLLRILEAEREALHPQSQGA